MRISLRIHCAVVFSLFLFSFSSPAQQPEYVISQRLRLTTTANGLNGWLEVVIDSRLTPELQEQMWGNGDWSFVFPEGDPLYAVFEKKPPRNAQLRISADDGTVVQNLALDQPLARIKEVQLINGKTSFLVGVDYSVGFGSYAGVTTQILDVRDRQLQWAVATDINTNDAQPIRLPKTLKSQWKLIPFRKNKDILWVYCRPAKVEVSGREFVIGYVRYRFDGQRWIRHEKLRNGIWESDQRFPNISSFP